MGFTKKSTKAVGAKTRTKKSSPKKPANKAGVKAAGPRRGTNSSLNASGSSSSGTSGSSSNGTGGVSASSGAGSSSSVQTRKSRTDSLIKLFDTPAEVARTNPRHHPHSGGVGAAVSTTSYATDNNTSGNFTNANTSSTSSTSSSSNKSSGKSGGKSGNNRATSATTGNSGVSSGSCGTSDTNGGTGSGSDSSGRGQHLRGAEASATDAAEVLLQLQHGQPSSGANVAGLVIPEGVRACQGVTRDINYFAECALHAIIGELNVIDGVFRARQCAGVVMCDECRAKYKNLTRKRKSWQRDAEVERQALLVHAAAAGGPAPTATAVDGDAHMKKKRKSEPLFLLPAAPQPNHLWQSPAEARADVITTYKVLSGAARTNELTRIAKHLELEPDLCIAINPVHLPDTNLVVAFCPVDTRLQPNVKCHFFEVKKNRKNLVLVCTRCAARIRYITQHGILDPEGGQVHDDSLSTLQHDSHTRVSYLQHENLVLRYRQKALKVKLLQHALARSHAQRQRHLVQHNMQQGQDDYLMHEHVAADARAAVQHLQSPAGRAALHTTLQDILSSDLRCMLAKKRKNREKYTPQEIDAMVADHVTASQPTLDFVSEQMQILSKRLSGNAKTAHFSPLTIKLALGVYSCSASGYEEAAAAIQLPSLPSVTKIKQSLKTHPGECLVAYLQALKRNGGVGSEGELVGDEVKVQQGVMWTTSDHQITGFVEDSVDLAAVGAELLRGAVGGDATAAETPAETAGSVRDDKAPELVQYINQFMFRSTLKGGPTFPVEYIASAAQVSGAIILKQVLHVVRCCELCGFLVHAVCCDAGGGNGSFFKLMREAGPTARNNDPWLPQEFTSLPHPADSSRRLFLYHCITHLLKAFRNAIYASRPGGARTLQWQGHSITWLAIIDQYQRDSAVMDRAQRTDLTAAGLKLDGWVAMNVPKAKAIFSDKTVLEALDYAENILGVTCPSPSPAVVSTFLISRGMQNKMIGLLSWRASYLLSLNQWPTDLFNPLATTLFQAHMNEMFNSLLMCATERITHDNADSVKAFLHGKMTWLAAWRTEAQEQSNVNKDWALLCIASETFLNIRMGVCGFVDFAIYQLARQRAVPDFYMPVLLSNSSVIESFFSAIRNRRPVKIDVRGYQSSSALLDMKRTSHALKNNPAYDEEDCGDVEALPFIAPSLGEQRKSNRAFLLRIDHHLSALVKPVYKPDVFSGDRTSPSTAVSVFASHTLHDIVESAAAGHVGTVASDGTENIHSLFSAADIHETSFDDEFTFNEAAMEDLLQLLPQDRCADLPALSPRSHAAATATSTSSAASSSTPPTLSTSSIGSGFMQTFFSLNKGLSLLECMLRSPLFQQYYRLSLGTRYESWFVALFNTIPSNTATVVRSGRASSSSSRREDIPLSMTPAFDNAVTASQPQYTVSDRIEAWLWDTMLGALSVVTTCVSSCKPDQIPLLLWLYHRDHKQHSNELVLEEKCGFPLTSHLHLDVVFAVIQRLFEDAFTAMVMSSGSISSGGSSSDNTTIARESTLLSEHDRNHEFLAFIGYAVVDTTRVVRESKHTNKRTMLLHVLQQLRGTAELLGVDFIPTSITSADRGKYTYVRPELVEWGMSLLHIIRTSVNIRTLANNSMSSAWQRISHDESLFALFETAFDSIGLQLSDLPSGVTLHSFANVLAKKVFHARCGAIFRRVSDVLTTKSTVYLREGLKGYSAARYNADHRAGAATSHA